MRLERLLHVTSGAASLRSSLVNGVRGVAQKQHGDAGGVGIGLECLAYRVTVGARQAHVNESHLRLELFCPRHAVLAVAGSGHLEVFVRKGDLHHLLHCHAVVYQE